MEQQIYSKIDQNEIDHWWYVSRRNIIKKILDSFLSSDPNQTILEIGCGSGGNLTLLSDYGLVHAVEMNDAAREIAAHRKICAVKKGSLPDHLPFDRNFDLVCLFDVIEHVADDTKSLREISNKLNPNGKILLTVPAFKFLWSNHDVTAHHKRRYTSKQMQSLLRDTGYNLLYVSYFNTFLFPIVVLVRAFQKLFSIESKIEFKQPQKLINMTLRKVFSSERFFLPLVTFPFGVSILLLAEKAET